MKKKMQAVTVLGVLGGSIPPCPANSQWEVAGS